MIKATELRIGNFVKVPNDAGVYLISEICGWTRVFDSKEDFDKYQDLESAYTKSGNLKKGWIAPKFHDERLLKIEGGARDNEIRRESKLQSFKLDQDWLTKFGFYLYGGNTSEKHFQKTPDDLREFNLIHILDSNQFFFSDVEIKSVHDLQNLYFALTRTELEFA